MFDPKDLNRIKVFTENEFNKLFTIRNKEGN